MNKNFNKKGKKISKEVDLTDQPFSKEDFKKKFNQESEVKDNKHYLEKSYLRLTEIVDSKDVRDIQEIKKAFKFVKKEIDAGKKDHEWAVDQLRTIRQELTVHNIMNHFSLGVYLVSFKYSLLTKNTQQIRETMGQFFIYINSGLLDNVDNINNDNESINIISYWIVMAVQDNRSHDLLRLLQIISNQSLYSKQTKQALLFRNWFSIGNYFQVLKFLKDNQDGVFKAIYDLFEDQIKFKFLQSICKGFGPKIKQTVINKYLLFDCLQELKKFLLKHGCVLSGNNEEYLMNKESKNQLV